MEFRDLKTQYEIHKKEIDASISAVLQNTNFISGNQVAELERQLAAYTNVKYCISCANGTDALQLALMTWKIGPGDAVFIPDFTFFSTAEVVSAVGAIPVFVEVGNDFNISVSDLEAKIKWVENEMEWIPKAVIAVDLFGQSADYNKIRELTNKYHLLLLEDSAQGFGGRIEQKKNCSFGDISTTSFFPAKPLGCYGDGGAIFTDNDEWAELLYSYRVHGKGQDKYDNVRIGMNSRLDTIQAAILKEKLKFFDPFEMNQINEAARIYTEGFSNMTGMKVPIVHQGYTSSWAQYTVRFETEEKRNIVQKILKDNGIPSMIYYRRPLHMQGAYKEYFKYYENMKTDDICKCVLSLPIHPYLSKEVQNFVIETLKNALSSL